MNADGSDAHPVRSENTRVFGLAWSPNGSKIAYVGQGGLKVMNADGSNPRVLASNYAYGYGFEPVWSPDSSKLAYIVFDGAPLEKGVKQDPDTAPFEGTNIHVVDVTTGEDWPLISGSTGNINPAWSPDGTQIAFASLRNGVSEIWTADMKGADLSQVTADQQLARYPMWQRSSQP